MTPTYNPQATPAIAAECNGTVTINSLVKIDNTGKVVVTTAITDDVYGVALQAGVSGDMIPVQQFGRAKIVCSAAVNPAAQVMPGASGKCATAAGATAKSFGIAESTTGANNELLMVTLRLGVNGPANT